MQKLILILIFFLNFGNLFSNEEYFLTLRNEKVNLRQGPSFDYPVKIFYKKKYLPVLVQDKSDNFRKIRDHENNSGWIHISQLSKKKAAIVIDDNLILFSNSTMYSNPIAILKKGRLVKIKKCKENWCKIMTGEFKGWIKKESLWGLL
ncbi:SH3 domain-containing protein [Pelagibacteraceae bacterium]|jgi:SH3-like domain-containing protein|nr:SH3 domain-containing protein [Pelagibacteraceae bacterium]|tara:strand:+ start:2830 stop:3273 length:444 start_codon:yes stop_codon:yes gene_type:complete